MDYKDKDLEKLIRKVTKETLGTLSLNPDKFTALNNNKSILILIPDNVIGLSKYFDFLSQKYISYNVVVAGNLVIDDIKNNLDKFNIVKYIELNDSKSLSKILDNLKGYSEVTLVSPKYVEMKAVSEFDDEKMINHIVINSLLNNQSVDIILNYESDLISKQPILKERLSGLKKLGINIINIAKKGESETQDKISKLDFINEKTIVDLHSSGYESIVINSKQIITPLAKDKARSLGIKIEVKD